MVSGLGLGFAGGLGFEDWAGFRVLDFGSSAPLKVSDQQSRQVSRYSQSITAQYDSIVNWASRLNCQTFTLGLRSRGFGFRDSSWLHGGTAFGCYPYAPQTEHAI